jgi:preprotein translocase subunit SecD
MMTRGLRFNLNLVLALALGIVCGCKSADPQKKVFGTLRLHQEAHPDPMGRTETAEIEAETPIRFTIYKEPFLTEKNIKEAKVIDVIGGFALQIQFDRQGSWLLEEYTSANQNKHILVESQVFGPGEEKLNKGRWLAAPQIRNHITDGLFTFTPEASREEAEQIALGLNHVAAKLAAGEDIK